MKWFSNQKIGTRLALSFGLIMFFFSITSAYFYYNMNNLSNAMDSMKSEGDKSRLAQDIQNQIGSVFLHIAYMVNSPDSAEREGYFEELETARAIYKADVAEIRAMSVEQKGIDLLDNIQNSIAETRAINDQVTTLALDGDIDQASDILKNQSIPLNDKIDAAIAEYLDYRHEKLAATIQSAEKIKSETEIALIASALFVLAVIVLITVFTTRGITLPLNMTTGLLKEISAGNLTVVVQKGELERKDELGQMGNSMSLLINNLRTSLGGIQNSMQMLASASTELSSISEEMTAGASESSSKAHAVAAAAEELSANTISVAAGVEQATSNLASVATATEEMTATIAEIAGNSEKARFTTTEAARQADNVSMVMKDLGQAAQEIGKVTETINSISAQTNLLALNATIEAARAGAAGKGFAVVANEIKELAQQTAAATGEIKTRIATVQASTAGAVADIDKIVHVIKDVNDIVNAIASAIEEQSVVTRDIAGNIAQASSGVKDANRRISQTATVSKDIAEDISGVSMTANQMSSASQQVQTSATELSHLAENLREMLLQYKVKATD